MAHSSLSNMGDSWSPRWRSLHPVLTDYEILDALKDSLQEKFAARSQDCHIFSLQILKQSAPSFRLPNGRLCHWAQSTKTASLSIEAAICKHMPHLWRGPHKHYPLRHGQKPSPATGILYGTPDFPTTLTVPGIHRFGKKRWRTHALNAATRWPLLICNHQDARQFLQGIHALRAEVFCRRHADIRFCVVREPVERFVSAVAFIFYRDNRHKEGIPLQDYLEKTLEKMTGGSGFGDDHLTRQIRFIGSDPSYYTHIFRMGDWRRLETCLSEWLGKSVHMPHENPSRGKEKISLTPALRRRVEAFYAKDYKFWGKYF